MDAYTRKTMEWLNERYRSVDASGVYFAHQPIYGFRRDHSEPGVLTRYGMTLQILKALAHLEMQSLLDVGCSEGYKAHLVAEFFGIPARGCDLSEEACRRAREIYGIPTDVVDVHALPYADGEFDVVLCSETLEHVTDFRKGLAEIVRVARRAVLITVPHEPPETIERYRREGEPHAHIHSLDEHSFDFLREQGCPVLVQKVHTPAMKFGALLADAQTVKFNPKYPRWFLDVYNACVPLLKAVMRKQAAIAVMRLDEYFSRKASSYDAMVVTVMKDRSIFRDVPSPIITPRQVLAQQVPFYYLKSTTSEP